LEPDPTGDQLSVTIHGDLAQILSVCGEVGGTNKKPPSGFADGGFCIWLRERETTETCKTGMGPVADSLLPVIDAASHDIE
jgi:hypothetical protein